MMKSGSGNFTHGRAIDATKFRAQATGVGVCVDDSLATGQARLNKVVPTIKHPAAVPHDEGFATAKVPPDDDDDDCCLTGNGWM